MKDQLTPLKETGIYIVEVEIGAYNFSNKHVPAQIDYLKDVHYKGGHLVFEDSIILKDHYKDNWQILGTITKDIINFDPAPYLEKLNSGFYADYLNGGNLKCYNDFSSEESFRSLLRSCGCEIENKLHLAISKSKL